MLRLGGTDHTHYTSWSMIGRWYFVLRSDRNCKDFVKSTLRRVLFFDGKCRQCLWPLARSILTLIQ